MAPGYYWLIWPPPPNGRPPASPEVVCVEEDGGVKHCGFDDLDREYVGYYQELHCRFVGPLTPPPR